MNKVIAVKVQKDKAQEIIKKIKENNNFNNNYRIKKTENHIIIPVKEITDDLKEFKKTEIENPIKQKEIGISYKDVLKTKKVPIEIISELPKAYDIVGDIVIINIQDTEIIKKYSKEIGDSLQKINPHIKVVLNKAKEHHGVFRTQDLKWIWGEKRKETIIKENGCKLKTDVEKVFYSTRLATERNRIASLVKENEVVGVFFAGVGPFAIEIYKNAKPKEVVAIELNPIGVDYLQENIKINHMEGKVIPILGDVKEVSKKYKNYFDRIPMPLPKSAELFLDSAIYSIKNNGVIHIYNFVSKRDPYTEIEKIIKNKEKENNCKLEIINRRIIRSFSPAVVQIVLDIKVHKN